MNLDSIPVFWLYNNHCEFSTYTHNFLKISEMKTQTDTKRFYKEKSLNVKRLKFLKTKFSKLDSKYIFCTLLNLF